MNPARSLRAALVLNDQTSWWAYLAGPAVGGAIAAGIAYGLRGPRVGGLGGARTAGAHWAPAGCAWPGA
jgi:aquaporin Z